MTRKRPAQAQLARQRGFESTAQMRVHGRHVRNAKALFALPAAAQQARQASLDAVAAVRREPSLSLDKAARRHGVTVSTVRFFAGDVVSRRGSRWDVRAADRLFRPMYVYSGGEIMPVDVRGSRRSTLASEHVTAVSDFLRGADPKGSGLAGFAGRSVGGFELETDLDVLEAMADRGEFDFDSIYRVTQP